MRSFHHVNAATLEEAWAALDHYRGGARLNAGGTDLMARLKGDIHPRYPLALVNIKTIAGLDRIRETDAYIRIGALARLADLCRSDTLTHRFPALAEAVRTVAGPQIRNVATIGGNLCQEVRCWYYRYPRSMGGPIQCARKGKGPCLAVKGDNRYHAILGAKKCFAVCPSDTAVALTALDARLVLAAPGSERIMAVPDFYHSLGNALQEYEIVREIRIPKPDGAAKQTFTKFTLRKPIDFAVVSAAVVLTLDGHRCTDARIVLGAVAPAPWRAPAAEKVLVDRPVTKETAAAAARAAVADAKPLAQNGYKIEIAKALVEEAILDELQDHGTG